jgi:hypothetical protein
MPTFKLHSVALLTFKNAILSVFVVGVRAPAVRQSVTRP